jgi:hypothetical protein
MSNFEENNNIISTATVQLSGYFEAELIHKPTGVVKQKLQFSNTIANGMLNYIGDSFNLGQSSFYYSLFTDAYMAVGTGTTAPAVTDTKLVNEIARTKSLGSPAITITSGYNAEAIYWWKKVTKVFLPGVGTNSNLTEVGIFDDSNANINGGTLFVRQLFRDINGTPTSINKQAEDELRLTYELRLYPQQVSSVSTLTINGVSTTCTTRGYDVDSTSPGRWGDTNNGSTGLMNQFGRVWANSTSTSRVGAFPTHSMPSLTSTQVGTVTASSAATWGTYTTGSYYRDQTITFNPGLGNLTIGSIIWGSPNADPGQNAPFITTFNPPFTKTSTQRATFVGRLSWGRGTS